MDQCEVLWIFKNIALDLGSMCMSHWRSQWDITKFKIWFWGSKFPRWVVFLKIARALSSPVLPTYHLFTIFSNIWTVYKIYFEHFFFFFCRSRVSEFCNLFWELSGVWLVVWSKCSEEDKIPWSIAVTIRQWTGLPRSSR